MHVLALDHTISGTDIFPPHLTGTETKIQRGAVRAPDSSPVLIPFYSVASEIPSHKSDNEAQGQSRPHSGCHSPGATQGSSIAQFVLVAT